MARIPGRDRALPISWFGGVGAPEATDDATASPVGEMVTMYVDEEGLSDGSASTDTTIEDDYGSV